MKEESDFLKDLMNHVSKKIGRPYSAVAPMEQELRKNWYDTPEAIQSITDEQFDKMGIPMRVVTAIRAELTSNSGQNAQEFQQHGSSISPPTSQVRKQEVKQTNKSQLNEASIMHHTQTLQNKMMEKYPWVGSDLLKIFQTLYKIIKNIISDSYELKFRILKKSNQRIKEVVLDNPPVLDYLKAIGFEQDEEKIFLDTFDTQAYFFVQECLEAVISNHSQQNSQQNKHLKNIKKEQPRDKLFLPIDLKLPSTQGTSVDLKDAYNKQSLQSANYAEELQKLIQFRKQIMSQPPKDRKVRIYHKRYDVREVPHIVIDMDQQMGNVQNNMIAKYWVNVMKNNQKNAKFQSKRKTQFQYLLAQQVYRETTIKLRLPNQLIIQAAFGPLQTLKDVFNLCAKIVIGDFYIYQAPPVKKLDKEMHRTLDSLDSVPCGYFYIGLNSEWYIAQPYAQLIRQ